ncbi:hypothetical protein Hanom_Chr11g00996901 [Helianthus anomalus]
MSWMLGQSIIPNSRTQIPSSVSPQNDLNVTIGCQPNGTSPHSNPEVAGSSLARSQCPYGSGFTPRLRLAGWRSAKWDPPGRWGPGGIPPPPPQNDLNVNCGFP